MRMLFPVFAVICFLLPFSAAAVPDGWHESYSEALAQARNSKKPLVLFFTGSDWCPSCMEMERTVLSDPAFRSFLMENFIPVYLDFPRHPVKNAAENEKVLQRILGRQFTFPTTVVLSPEEKIFGQFSGKAGKETFRKLLASLRDPPRALRTVITGSAADLQTVLAGGADPNEADWTGVTPLMRAAKEGDAAKVQVLLQGGADTAKKDLGGLTALIYAIRAHRHAALDLLLLAGADVNAVTVQKETPLYFAVTAGDATAVQRLLRAGAKVDQGVGKYAIPPAGIAILLEQRSIAEMLLASGADLRVQDRNGSSLMHYAASLGDRRMVRMLLDRGAPAQLRDSDGRQPCDFTADPQLLQMLKNTKK